jgi:hypothetical protein
MLAPLVVCSGSGQFLEYLVAFSCGYAYLPRGIVKFVQ